MPHDPIAARYADALFELAKHEGKAEEVLNDLRSLGEIVLGSAALQGLLLNPGVSAADKMGIFERVLPKSWSELVKAFVHMVISLGRVDKLTEIVEAFEAAVDEDRRRVHVEVRSAHPLSATALCRLQKKLEQLEDKEILLESKIVPGLLGGFQVLVGYKVIDSSVRRQLDDLKERLLTARVH